MTPRASGVTDGTGIPRATAAWNGGTSVLDSWGVWGMDHVAQGSALTAKLSWFTLEDSVIALGAGITSTTGQAVESTVENRALHAGTPALTVDDSVIVGAVGESSVLAQPSWAHLEGVGGYVFLTPQRTRVRRQRRHGTWWDINQGASTSSDQDPQKLDFATISLLHGKSPTGRAYAYAILPTASVQETRAYGHRHGNGKGPQVLANDATVQSISAPMRPGRLFLANAFAAAKIGWLTTDGPASVAVAQESRSITVAVSDPSRTDKTVTITLPELNGRGIDSADPSVTVVDLRPVTLRIAVGGTRGVSQRITLRR